VLDKPLVADLREEVVHAFLLLALAGVVAFRDVDEVLRGAVAGGLDRLETARGTFLTLP
jgi:hypothetical protein